MVLPSVRPPLVFCVCWRYLFFQVVSRAQKKKKKRRERHSLDPLPPRPNYISQDDDKDQPCGYNTRSRTTSIMQEAMLVCINITKPTFELSAQKMASRKLPMTWICKMANSVHRENGELLEYRHLIANPKTRATWTHSYRNKLGRLAQGMPSRAQGTDTIFFIPRHNLRTNHMSGPT
jgi:hypothetical protein